ncbi:diguanylate cyclase [Ideonella sp. 4Y16]|uniref:diguanylate cyclase n=1 Tax=Ideonella aquatica TaxID=2824119 RepID=A0A940YM36_9BURK|nr:MULTISPECIES: diguanylate cyclase [Ideonella]MBQ0946167.1 diguanylate cyclase [Ideonella alba]MBQ0960409.1 diguanylate cyclase [Ideonella aquatica]
MDTQVDPTRQAMAANNVAPVTRWASSHDRRGVRVVIATADEALSSQLARLVSNSRPHWQLQAKVASAQELMVYLGNHSPDVLLVDADLAFNEDCGWLSLTAGQMAMVMIAGQDHHAVQAFDAGALDCLARPVSRLRLDLSLDRVVSARRARQSEEVARHTSTRVAQLQNQVGELLCEVARLKRQLRLAHLESRSDALTGLGNRRELDERLQSEISRARRGHQPLAVLILDIDNFKSVNDQVSHAAGDEVLRRLAHTLLASCRGHDATVRMGGDEFAVVLPMTTVQDARHVADKIMTLFATINWGGLLPAAMRPTISVGATELVAGDDAGALLGRADRHLQWAKTAGKARLVWEAL